MQCRFCTRAIDVENPWGHRWIEDHGCCDECLEVRTCIEAAFGRHSIGDPNILMLIMTSLRMVEEAPIVHYMHETWNCQTHPAEVVLPHCRSGKDRSAFTVFALLQLQYDLEEDAARAALAGRVGRDGRCLANVDVGHGPNWEWLSKELRAKGLRVTGV